MKNNQMFMNTTSAFATANAGTSCAQMPCASESEYVMLSVGTVLAVSTFAFHVSRVVGVIVAVMLAIRLWAVSKTK